jgi:hypothetical protein
MIHTWVDASIDTTLGINRVLHVSSYDTSWYCLFDDSRACDSISLSVPLSTFRVMSHNAHDGGTVV